MHVVGAARVANCNAICFCYSHRFLEKEVVPKPRKGNSRCAVIPYCDYTREMKVEWVGSKVRKGKDGDFIGPLPPHSASLKNCALEYTLRVILGCTM